MPRSGSGAGEPFFRRRAYQGGIAKRKTMIDRGHDLSIARQAEVLKISRGSVYRARCRTPTSPSCGIWIGCSWSSRSPVRVCCERARFPGVQDRSPACEDAEAAVGIEALYRCPRTSKPVRATRSIRICCAASRSASEPGLGHGHHLHPDGARLRLSRHRARLGDPPGFVLAAVDHDGQRSKASFQPCDMIPDQAYFNLPPLRAAA
jgi:hypothetical protein